MIVRNLLNNATVTSGGTMVVGAISAGLYVPLRFEQVSTVTSIKVNYLRNGATTVEAVIIPYENSIFDLSSMTPAFPSIIELTKDYNSGLSAADFIRIFYVEGGTSKMINLQVINACVAEGRFGDQASSQNMTDYGNGKFNRLDFSISGISPLSGVPYNNIVIFGQNNISDRIKYRAGGTGTSSETNNGAKWNQANPPNLIFRTFDDAYVWGNVVYEQKNPYCSNPKHRVTLRWINSKGCADSMYFYKYRIQPVYQLNATGGNRVLSYDVTVYTTVTEDNQNALYWMTRSQSIGGVFPIDTTQWALVTISNPNAYNLRGGALGMEVSFKCKFQIVER